MSDTTTDLERALIDDIEARSDEIVDVLSTLIAFDTTAWQPGDPPRDEAALQAFVASRLARAGFATDVWEPDPVPLRTHRQIADERFEFTGRPQLKATKPGSDPENGRSLLMCGHVDVVSAEPESAWLSPPRAAVIRDGLLYGRGAADMKGGVAAMIVAAEAVARHTQLEGDLTICTVTDEEATGAGAIAAVQRGARADAGIIPEPTGFDVWVACRGDVIPTIVVPGRAGHAGVAQPHHSQGGAVNAIDKAMHVLQELKALHASWKSKQHPYLSPPHVLPVKIKGGGWVVTYPSECRMTMHVTYLPEDADADGWGTDVEREIAEAVERAAASDPDGWLALNPPRIEWSVDIPPAEVPEDHPIVATVRDAARRAGSAETPVSGLDSWHDGATFTRFGGTPTVCWGTRGLEVAHAVDEYVPVDDLVTVAKGLAVAALRFCGPASG